MLLGKFIYSMVCVIFFLESSIFAMKQNEKCEVEIEMSEVISGNKATLSSLIQQILNDNPRQCKECKKEIVSFDVSYYLFNIHNSAQLLKDDCMVCFKQDSQNTQKASDYFDAYKLHDSCYQKLCRKIKKSTCSKCTQKKMSPNNDSRNKSSTKKACACGATLCTGLACCCTWTKKFHCRQAFHELGLSCCGCFLEIINAFSSSSD